MQVAADNDIVMEDDAGWKCQNADAAAADDN